MLVETDFNISEAARRLGWDLDLLLVADIEAPGLSTTPLGFALDTPDPHLVVDEETARRCKLPPGYLHDTSQHALTEMARRHRVYFGEDDPSSHQLANRDVILVHGERDMALASIVSDRFERDGAHIVRTLVLPPVEADEVDETSVAQLLKEARRFHLQLHQLH